MPYQSGQPVPPGYHVETRSSVFLAAAGFSMAGAMWLMSALIGLSFAEETDSPEMYSLCIPLAGPFLLFDDTDDDFEVLLDMLLVFDAAVQVAGVVIGVLGLGNTKEILVADTTVARVSPVIGPGFAGLRATF